MGSKISSNGAAQKLPERIAIVERELVIHYKHLPTNRLTMLLASVKDASFVSTKWFLTGQDSSFNLEDLVLELRASTCPYSAALEGVEDLPGLVPEKSRSELLAEAAAFPTARQRIEASRQFATKSRFGAL